MRRESESETGGKVKKKRKQKLKLLFLFVKCSLAIFVKQLAFKIHRLQSSKAMGLSCGSHPFKKKRKPKTKKKKKLNLSHKSNHKSTNLQSKTRMSSNVAWGWWVWFILYYSTIVNMHADKKKAKRREGWISHFWKLETLICFSVMKEQKVKIRLQSACLLKKKAEKEKLGEKKKREERPLFCFDIFYSLSGCPPKLTIHYEESHIYFDE